MMEDSEKLTIFSEVIERLGMDEFDSHVFLNMLQRRFPIAYASLLKGKDDADAHRGIGKFLSNNQKALNIENTGEMRESLNMHNTMTKVPLWHYVKSTNN